MESSLNLTMRHWKSMDDLRYCVSAKKTYRLSDIRGSRTKEESYKVYSGDGIPDPGFRLGHCNNFLRCIRKKGISFWTGI